MHPSAEDHVAITQLLARYCLALDADDVEAWVALFTPDARFEVYGRSWDGHDGLREMAGAAPGGLHLGGPPVIDLVDADHATTKQNLLFVDRSDGSSRHAVYTDELVKSAAGWRIKRRTTQFITADGLSDRPPRKRSSEVPPALVGEIGQVSAAYSWYVDTADAAGLEEILSPGMVFAYGGRETVGREEVIRFLVGSVRGTHVAGPPLVGVTEAGATARSRFVFVPADGGRPVSGGYADELVRADGRWVFARRTVVRSGTA